MSVNKRISHSLRRIYDRMPMECSATTKHMMTTCYRWFTEAVRALNEEGNELQMTHSHVNSADTAHAHFPPEIAAAVKNDLSHCLEFRAANTKCRFLFFTNTASTDMRRECARQASRMRVWLKVISRIGPPMCPHIRQGQGELVVKIYYTNQCKRLPGRTMPLERTHVNSAFTQTCVQHPDIVIFRREECFKVFIHETFHTFGLDFSGMPRETVVRAMRQVVSVSTTGNLFEAYTEAWARFIHCAYCAFETTDTVKTFWPVAKELLHWERLFSAVQLLNVLRHLEISYTDVVGLERESMGRTDAKRYTEVTNVVAYYVIAGVLTLRCADFVAWCNVHGAVDAPFKFRSNVTTLRQFCDFLKDMLTSEKTRNILQQVSAGDVYVAGTLRMSACEPWGTRS
jgi:hypothetical protein